jgi:hypothetical protein
MLILHRGYCTGSRLLKNAAFAFVVLTHLARQSSATQ